MKAKANILLTGNRSAKKQCCVWAILCCLVFVGVDILVGKILHGESKSLAL
jgi:hypothetical protein